MRIKTMSNLLEVLVVKHLGRIYPRCVYDDDHRVYLDYEIASFKTLDEANDFIAENYPYED